jgi:transcriptional regulator with XRE-family HTH domain
MVVNSRETGMIAKALPSQAVGLRIRRLREGKGFSRLQLARKLGVDVSSLSGWESGKRLPRESVRLRLAGLLDCRLPVLLSPLEDDYPPFSARLLDGFAAYGKEILDCTLRAGMLRGARFASPFATVANLLPEWRQLVSERVLAGTLEVQRVEIFYGLDRLGEVLSNILRYDGKAYHVKYACAGLKEVAPFMGGYLYDDADLFLGAYWTGVPPQPRPILHLKGHRLTRFFMDYWSEMWGRATLLNIRGAHDLSTVRELALAMGLPPRKWNAFVEEARAYDVGDGAPALF